MDAFYASVEQRDNPSLRGKPVLVGGGERRGVVAAASYEARKFGARSAMPMAEAMRKCPSAIVVHPRMSRYAEVSEQVFAIFHRYTPLVQGLSLDEAFLDVTASHSLFGSGEAIARRIKNEIRTELGLNASAGVAPNRFVAKVASDLKKPDGLVVVDEADMRAFLAPLPIERMWGIGSKTAPKLHALGLSTLADLVSARASLLEEVLGSWGAHVQALARGEDEREVEPNLAAKSIGTERTYDEDLTDVQAIERSLLDHASRVAQRLVREKVCARVVTLKLKHADFTLRTKRVTLSEPVADAESIYLAAKMLLATINLSGARFRLTGVSVSALTDGPPPRTLFPNPRTEKLRKLEHVVAEVADRFGDAGITRATLLESDDEPRR